VIEAFLQLSDAEPLAFRDPRRVLAAERVGDVLAVIRAAEEEARAGRWVPGFVAYEAAPAFDPALRTRAPGPGPLAWFAVFDAPSEPRRAHGEARLDALTPELDRGAHAAAVERIRDAIGRGDVYQVNLTHRVAGRFEGDPLALHHRLRAAQGGGYTASFVLGDRAVVSASPELFFELRGDRITTRPMKGTVPRGRHPEEDDRLAAALAGSPKDRAENVMIVDLLRNDLGRIAVPGAVRVARMFEVERWRTVHQLTSTVEARLRPGTGVVDALAALFPCGSITGAPKIAATRMIAALERSPRGVYCGAAGLLRPGGDAVFNVAIRTVTLDLAHGGATAGTGGGITWDSSASAEWDEALAKLAFLSEDPRPFRLVETLRLESGRYPLLERHLARLGRSARHLGFRLDEGAAREALARRAAAVSSARVRLLLAQDGGLSLEDAPLPATPAQPLPVARARSPVSRRDRFLFHKTTRRAVYETRRAERPDVFDVILANEEGELTELCIGNLVVEVAGERLTPPIDCGLLAGVMREELLARGEVREAVLRDADLDRAERLWLVNALRGMVPIALVG
jgi:para-aminobenzoate synthetase/4-amino-4-deoxychorismate lyase